MRTGICQDGQPHDWRQVGVPTVEEAGEIRWRERCAVCQQGRDRRSGDQLEVKGTPRTLTLAP